jgi:hypothetical protein
MIESLAQPSVRVGLVYDAYATESTMIYSRGRVEFCCLLSDCALTFG